MQESKRYHRPLRPSAKPWVMTQILQDIFFIHFPVEKHLIAKFLPETITLDLYHGTAWVSIVPFRVVRMRLRGFPPIPLMHPYLQCNIRTYVSHQGIPGIYFLEIHVNKLPIVLGARLLTRLPYIRTNMIYTQKASQYSFSSGTNFKAIFEIKSEKKPLQKKGFHQWLLERYSMFTKIGQQLYRGDIHHLPWHIWQAAGELQKDSLSHYLSSGQEQPLLHYSSRKKMIIYPLIRADKE